jgi:CHAP domain
MSEWYERAYPGGPMVKVAGFPRPLYPPDAKQYGKQPSSPGDDVIAYKRTISRLGRWPWTEFDKNFTNGFSHGTSGNVRETGVAGFQRQMQIDDSGWIGEKTFNTLRSARIPAGLNHAGEPGMDATAVRLINQAWMKFKGSEPDAQGSSLRLAALKKARSQIGVREYPANSNRQKYGQWYGINGVPWCAIFVTWCFETAGNSPSFVKGSRYSFVPHIVGDARAGRYGLKTTNDPIPGDLVCFDWGWDTVYDHVGIFEKWLMGAGDFQAIEGNTSYANNSNGGQVLRRSRSVRQAKITFVRVRE